MKVFNSIYHMIPSLSKLIQITILFQLCMGCEEFIETNLEEEIVKMVSPGKDVIIKINPTTFYWEKVDGADNYELQLVAPSFASVQQFLVDTTVNKNSFTFTLPNTGSFEWRIKAKNNSTNSPYYYQKFEYEKNTTSEEDIVETNEEQ